MSPHAVAAAISGNWNLPKAGIVKAAERDICRAQLPKKPVVLLRLSGSGIENSPPFTVNSSQLTVHYHYDCSAAGGSGNFIADLLSGNQSSLNSDDQPIANALGAGGSATTTVYPQKQGSQYHLSVDSECSWTMIIKSP